MPVMLFQRGGRLETDKPSVLCRVQGHAAADALRGEHTAANEALVGAIKTAPSRSGVKLVDSMYSQDKTENIIIGRKDTRAQRGTHPAHAHLSHDGTKQRERPAKHTLTHTQAIRRARAGRAQGLLRAWVCSTRGVLAWRVHGVAGLLRKHELFFRLLVGGS